MSMKVAILLTALIASVALAASAEAATKKKKKTLYSASSTAQRAPAESNAVYFGGEYVGQDPDINIRAFMLRNPRVWDGPN
jgi:hypothetical protein